MSPENKAMRRTFKPDFDEYIAEAEMCERCAALSAQDEDRRAWLELAARWRAAAQWVQEGAEVSERLPANQRPMLH